MGDMTMSHRVLLFLLLPIGIGIAHGADSAAPRKADTSLFDPVASVVMHPRCINCHQIDWPRQTDRGIRHAQNVVRGTGGKTDRDGGHGYPTLQCTTCHQASNTAETRVPGAPHWQLAPLAMRWEGLSKAQICNALKDADSNGHRHGSEEVIEHVKTDPLVLWAWNPGAKRTRPPLSHPQFVEALETWAKAGMPCPE
jgi:hypothetical protein